MADHVCPVWMGYLLASPLRKLLQNPVRILGPHVRQGMRTLDIGCAMGFFSLSLARMVGPAGRVVCVDMQESMLRVLENRARKAGILNVIETRICDRRTLGLEDIAGSIDFALACYMVHEVPDPSAFFVQVRQALRPGGRVLVMEPRGHVSRGRFRSMVATALAQGFHPVDEPSTLGSRSALLERSRT